MVGDAARGNDQDCGRYSRAGTADEGTTAAERTAKRQSPNAKAGGYPAFATLLLLLGCFLLSYFFLCFFLCCHHSLL